MNRKNLSLALGVLWVASLVFAFVSGKSAGRTAGVAEIERRLGTPPSGAKSFVTIAGGRDASEVGAGTREGSAAPRGGDALSMVKRSLANPNPVDRMRAFMEAIAMMGRDDFGPTLDALKDEMRDGDNRREVGLLYYAWAEQDGAAALEHLDGLKLGREGWTFYQSALSAWGGSDPDGAQAWAQQKHEGKQDNENWYMIGVINGVAKNDVTRAGQIAQDIGFGRARGEALGVVVDELFKQGDESAAMRWVETMGGDDERFRAGAAGRVASAIAQQDPETAADWVLGLGIEDRDRAVTSVAYQWTRSSPEDAAAWSAAIEDPALRSRGMEAVVEAWARSDIQGAGTWLGQMQASPDLDAPVRSYALTVGRSDPQGAIGWANSITDEGMRAEVVQSLGTDWIRRSPEEARAFLQGQDGLPEGLQRLLQ